MTQTHKHKTPRHKGPSSRLWKEVSARVLAAAIGSGVACTGYELSFNQPEDSASPHAEIARTDFEHRLAKIRDGQSDVAETTDEETADTLETDKMKFVTEVMMNTDLGERDVTSLATRFNALPSQDGIRFRFYAENMQSGAFRNECLSEVDDTLAPEDAAEEVQDCMIAEGQEHLKRHGLVGLGGAVAGLGLFSAFGAASTRRKSKKAGHHPHQHGHAHKKPHAKPQTPKDPQA